MRQQVKNGLRTSPLVSCSFQPSRAVSLAFSGWIHYLRCFPVILSLLPSGKPDPPFFCFGKDLQAVAVSCSKGEMKPEAFPGLPWMSWHPLLLPSMWQGSSPHPGWQGRFPRGVLAVDLGLVVWEDSGSYANRALKSPTCLQSWLCFLSEKCFGGKFAFTLRKKTKPSSFGGNCFSTILMMLRNRTCFGGMGMRDHGTRNWIPKFLERL